MAVAAVVAVVAAATRFVWTFFLSLSLLLRFWCWGLPGSAFVPTGGQFNRCVRVIKKRLSMPASIRPKVLMSQNISGTVMMAAITLAIPPCIIPVISTAVTTEDLTAVADITESGLLGRNGYGCN